MKADPIVTVEPLPSNCPDRIESNESESNKSTSVSFAVTSFELSEKLISSVSVSKSKVSLSLTAFGASFTPLISITIWAVEVWPVASVIVYVKVSRNSFPWGIFSKSSLFGSSAYV